MSFTTLSSCALMALSIQAGPQDPIPADELSLRVSASAEVVEFGTAFELTVTQVWDSKLELEAWGAEKLAPLTARLLATERRADDKRIEETRRYECFAFEVGELTLPALFLRAKSSEDGSQRVALGEDLRITVLSTLEPEDDGVMETPRAVFPAPFPWAIVLLVIVSVTSLVALALKVFKRRPSAPPIVPPLPAHEMATERLRRLRAQTFETRPQIRSFHVEASGIVRTYIEDRFRVPSTGKTTEEFFADPATTAALRPGDRMSLGAFLRQGDLVKYAAQASNSSEREEFLISVAAFIETTRERPEVVVSEEEVST